MQTHSGAPAAIAEKTQNETPQAHQETNKLSTAAISADKHRLTPATIAEDILASRELSFEHANDTPSDRVEPESRTPIAQTNSGAQAAVADKTPASVADKTQAAVAEKTQNETTNALQETNKLSTAAISTDEHCLNPSTVAEDTLVHRPAPERVETKVIHSRQQDMPGAKNLELSMAAAAGERVAVARTPSPMQDEAESLRIQLQTSMRRDVIARAEAHKQMTELTNALAAAECANRLKDAQIAEMELHNSQLQEQVIELAQTRQLLQQARAEAQQARAELQLSREVAARTTAADAHPRSEYSAGRDTAEKAQKGLSRKVKVPWIKVVSTVEGDWFLTWPQVLKRWSTALMGICKLDLVNDQGLNIWVNTIINEGIEPGGNLQATIEQYDTDDINDTGDPARMDWQTFVKMFQEQTFATDLDPRRFEKALAAVTFPPGEVTETKINHFLTEFIRCHRAFDNDEAKNTFMGDTTGAAATRDAGAAQDLYDKCPEALQKVMNTFPQQGQERQA